MLTDCVYDGFYASGCRERGTQTTEIERLRTRASSWISRRHPFAICRRDNCETDGTLRVSRVLQPCRWGSVPEQDVVPLRTRAR